MRDYDGWTPKLVGEQMVEAIRWVARYGGSVGPASIRSSMPTFKPTLDDFADEGWGFPEVAADDGEHDDRPARALPSPGQVSRHMAALQWPAEYLMPVHAGSAQMLNLWLACKAARKPFDQAVKRRGTVSRAAAYSLRDRGLTLISVGLTRDGVPPHDGR